MIAQRQAIQEPQIVTRDDVEAHQARKGDLVVFATERGSKWECDKEGIGETGFALGRVTHFDRQDGMPYVEVVVSTWYLYGHQGYRRQQGQPAEERPLHRNLLGMEMKIDLGAISNHPYERLTSRDSMVGVARVENIVENIKHVSRDHPISRRNLSTGNLILAGKEVGIIKNVSVRNRLIGQDIWTVEAEFLNGDNAGKTVRFYA